LPQKKVSSTGTLYGIVLPHPLIEEFRFPTIISTVQHRVIVSKGKEISLSGKDLISIQAFWTWLRWLVTQAGAGETEILAYNVEYFARRYDRERGSSVASPPKTELELLQADIDAAMKIKGHLIVPVVPVPNNSRLRDDDYMIAWSVIHNCLELQSSFFLKFYNSLLLLK